MSSLGESSTLSSGVTESSLGESSLGESSTLSLGSLSGVLSEMMSALLHNVDPKSKSMALMGHGVVVSSVRKLMEGWGDVPLP